MIAWVTRETEPSAQEFMTRLYSRFYHLMFLTAGKYTSLSQDREDIVQTALEHLVKKVSLLQTLEPSALAAYIMCTVKHAAIDFMRERAKAGQWELPAGEAELISEEDLRPPEDSLLSREQLLLLRQTLAELPPQDRLLLEGKYILGYDSKELARRLGCKPNSVRMLLTRARRKALERLTEEMRRL